MIVSRLREEEKQRQVYNTCGSGNNWKGNTSTIPKAPKLANSKSNTRVKSTDMVSYLSNLMTVCTASNTQRCL